MLTDETKKKKIKEKNFEWIQKRRKKQKKK